jgi:translation initiation factor 2 subunit 2
MEYENLLKEAYNNLKEICPICGERFEVKKPEGHFEGNKTIITNFFQIASCLRRSPENIARFLFRQLATPGEISGGRLVLIKKVPSDKICEKIKQYAEEYVICANCKKPDTEIIETNGQKYLKCMACGNKKPVHDE